MARRKSKEQQAREHEAYLEQVRRENADDVPDFVKRIIIKKRYTEANPTNIFTEDTTDIDYTSGHWDHIPSNPKVLFDFKCPNRHCMGGKIDLTYEVADMIKNRQKERTGHADCNGRIEKYGYRCEISLDYNISIEYK